jgi:hypothetical protein
MFHDPLISDRSAMAGVVWGEEHGMDGGMLVFDDCQLVTGLPRLIVRGAGEPRNSTVMQGTSNLYWFGPS